MSLLLSVAKSLLYLYFGLYALFHIVIFTTPNAVNFLIFMNTVNFPFRDLTKPTAFGLNNVHNFYITNKIDDIRLGVWHFIPKYFTYDASVQASRPIEQHLREYVKITDEVPIVIYVHGNDRDRGANFRVELCKNLVNAGYHVFALDYRGYGDSGGWPSEEGTASDVIALYNVLVKHKPSAKIYFYGHSLGTGISSVASRRLSETDQHQNLKGLILEAPFLNASQAAKDYHLCLLFNNNNLIRKKVDEALELNNIRFNTDKNILKINTRVLIFHAEDDWFIPQSHGEQLYDIAIAQRPKDFPEVRYVGYGKEHGLGHFIHSHLPIYEEIKKMIDETW